MSKGQWLLYLIITNAIGQGVWLVNIYGQNSGQFAAGIFMIFFAGIIVVLDAGRVIINGLFDND